MPRDKKKHETGSKKKVAKPDSGKLTASGGASSKKAKSSKNTAKTQTKKKIVKKKKAIVRKVLPKINIIESESDNVVAMKSLQADIYDEDIFLDEDKVHRDVDMVELLTFSLLKKLYAFRISDIVEILQSQRTTHVPRTRSFVIGITTVRGKIVPVIDIAGLMDSKEKADYSNKGKVVVLTGPSGQVGIQMQRNLNIVSLPMEDIQPAPGHLSGSDAFFIEGVVKIDGDFVSIVDTDRVLSEPTAMGGS